MTFALLAADPAAPMGALALALDGVGLSGHYVVGQFRRGAAPVLLDPFAGGGRTRAPDPSEVRRWGAHETALRMLNNLVGSTRAATTSAARSARPSCASSSHSSPICMRRCWRSCETSARA